jgi:alkylation response protein AidB-like acyl-CoA dehydrogenase
MAKRSATDHALKQVHLAMRIYGAMGVAEEVGLEQLWYVRALQVAGGTMGILALIQGR